MLKKLITPIFLIGFFVSLAPTQVGGRVSYVTIKGNSMEPKMHTGDLAIVRKAAHYTIGEVVAYRHPKLGTVIHRIVKRQGDRFITKGDNNAWLDGYPFLQSDIVGKLWLHVPKAGRLAIGLQSPRNAAMLVGMLGTWAMSTGTKEERKRRGGRRRAPSESAPSPSTPSPGRRLLAGPSTENALLSAVVASVIFALLAVFAFHHPVTILTSKQVPYQQEGTFQYTASVPQGIYDQSAVVPGEPVFRRLASLVNVSFDYSLSTQAPFTAGGTYRLVAELRQSDGWQRTFDLTPNTPFTGAKFHAEGVLNLDMFQGVVSSLEAATGVAKDQQYNLDVVANVSTKGIIAGKPIEENFRPRLPFDLDPIKLSIHDQSAAPTTDASTKTNSPFTHSATGMVEQLRSTTNRISVLGLETAATSWRLIAIVGFALSFATAIVFARISLGSRNTRSTRIRAHYGPLLVDIEGGADIGGKRRVRVAEMDDLAKVAEQEGRMILHSHGSGGQDRYFVVSDDVVYYHLFPAAGPQPDPAARLAELHSNDLENARMVKNEGQPADTRVVETRNYDAPIPPEATPEGRG